MSDEAEHIDVVLEEPKKVDPEAPDVEIIEETPEVSAKSEKKHEVTPEEGISELKKSLEREKSARAEAEKRAFEANAQAKRAHENTAEAQYQLVSNALETIKERAESLKHAYAESMSVGDYAKAAEIQNAMSINATQLEKLKDGKKAMKKQLREAEKLAEQSINPVSPPQGDIVDQIASTVSPKSAEWLRGARDYIKDARDVRKMARAHEDAVDDGIQPDTDEYFEFIESRLGINRRVAETQVESPLSAASAPTQRRSVSPPPAPVSRGNGQRPNTMRLSRVEAEAARDMGLTPEEYAKNKSMLIKEGRYGH